MKLAADERGIQQINSQKRSKAMKIQTEFPQLFFSYPRNSAFIRGCFLLLLHYRAGVSINMKFAADARGSNQTIFQRTK